jgi:hypothetical protein
MMTRSENITYPYTDTVRLYRGLPVSDIDRKGGNYLPWFSKIDGRQISWIKINQPIKCSKAAKEQGVIWIEYYMTTPRQTA